MITPKSSPLHPPCGKLSSTSDGREQQKTNKTTSVEWVRDFNRQSQGNFLECYRMLPGTVSVRPPASSHSHTYSLS